ncbi:unnamed protein product [Malus baccata var. baccata]
MAVRSLIKRLLVYEKGRRQERELLEKEEQEWQLGALTSQDESREESCREELERAIQMAECIYDLDGPDDLPENLELVEFLCAEPNKPPPEVQDPLEVIDLGTEEDPRPIQISDARFRITLVEHRMPINEGYKPVKQAPRRMSKEIEDKVKEEIERLVKAGFIKPARYVEWLANIVPVLKAITKAVRCCFDYKNINSATPKDEYPMPMADLSIDAVAKHKVLSFMDENAGYNQIKMAQEDIHKTTFRCTGHVGAYEYLVMPFGLKNTGATYQRAMNAIFHDLIGHNMEVYIDDIVVKSKIEEQHLIDLRQALTRMRIHKLKMNPNKCAFGIRAGNLLGFLVHQRGVEVDKNKSRAIMESPSPTNKVQLQRLLGKINFLRRFIANLAGKIQPLTHLLRLKDKENFAWGPPHQRAFDSITTYLTSPPVLITKGTNNRAKYEALIIGLEILMDLGATEVEVFGYSELVINQLNGEFKCRHITMAGYYLAATQLLSNWDYEISVNHVPRGSNLAANEMAQLASGVPIQERKYEVDVEIQRRNLPSIMERGFSLDVMILETEIED